MRIIIAGAGDVGFHLAKLLAYEEQDIALLDLDQERLRYASNHLDVATIKGSATSYSVLKEAKIEKADLMIAVTDAEETNIAAAIIGKNLGAKKTVARVSNPEFLLDRKILDLKDLGIDEIISPETLAAKEIKRLLGQSTVTDSFEFENGKLTLVGIAIDEDSELKDKFLTEIAYLNPDHNFTTVAILRNNETIIPHGSNKFMLNDHAYFIAQPDGVDRVLKLSKKPAFPIKNVMILGGSRVGIHTARRLSKTYNIKLIEQDKDKCFELADYLPDTLIINGDGRDVNLLQEEGLKDMDAFIAVTGDSENQYDFFVGCQES